MHLLCVPRWRNDRPFSDTPIVAVSLTRHPDEAHFLDAKVIAGFAYLPTLRLDEAQRVLTSLRRKRAGINPPDAISWPGQPQVAHLR
jgi:hypothetical protein